MKIAVVDDDYTVRTLITEFFQDEGHKVTTADRPSLLDDLRPYDVVVMDVMIGRNDRYAGIDYILKQRGENRIRPDSIIIFISNFGRGTPEIENRLQQVGEYSWFDKPLELTDLDRKIRTLRKGKSK